MKEIQTASKSNDRQRIAGIFRFLAIEDRYYKTLIRFIEAKIKRNAIDSEDGRVPRDFREGRN